MHLLVGILTGILLASAISVISWQRKWLSVNGAVAATLMGSIVWMAGCWLAALPLLLFFISSSMLSLAFKKNASHFDKKEDQPRDAMQVFCNGGVAVLFLLLFVVFKNEHYLFAYWTSLAISSSDTWSSTIGNRFAGKVIDIKNGKVLAKGLSGGVSLAGSMGGLAGAFLIGVAGWLLYRQNSYLLLVSFAGFCGMIVDSLMGSLLQARYRMPDGRQIEYAMPGSKARLEKGFGWMSNDWVNLISNLVTTLVTLAIIES